MITILDYGAGNLSSVKNALDYLGMDNSTTDNPKKILSAERIILPGVGSFGFLMDQLRKKNLEKPLKKAIEKGTPFFGICLGLQALFEESEESPGVPGLSIFKGNVQQFRKGKVPQIGWNKIIPEKEGIIQEGFAYFVNSFVAVPKDPTIIAATSDYYGRYVCAVQWKNITATQFHPEKSGDYGLCTLKRWLQ
ncbi:TPA: imidazole glycerol phosphate synthase subunit HisH [Candidatus Woesearchaeota archaeon]|nr:imidazole glycerol phosphate synthase subunit HisH [Candidatus Woesearchaeota archaeon]HIH49033.1 imidazole glycerol phosphate synthase subunit HisH [Candidatus Woesearchaeota archaeon]HIJ03036.1 imidazole glycerol phosphate synthase subunit HisH [Candidatus Woesearchaeota archaeon]